jgi:Spy/CpxP family protein refolding chaperone
MRKLIAILVVCVAPALAAQQDSTAPPDSAERERLQQQIEDRFGRLVQQQLQLSDDQAVKLRGTEERFRGRRREILRRQLALRLGLNAQMCPGCSANPDSVRRLMDGIETNRAELFRLQQDQDREIAGYLTPVQRARYQILRERFFRRLTEVRRERLEGREGRRPLRPRRRPLR